MISKLQIDANRRNALLSTGPRSARGRNIAKMNALKHGLTARQITLFDEAPDDFERFHAELMVSLRPKGAMELALAERVVICAWRLRRVYRVESGLFSSRRKSWVAGQSSTTSEIDIVFGRLTSGEDELTKLSRYEASIERSLHRALRELDRRRVRTSEKSAPDDKIQS